MVAHLVDTGHANDRFIVFAVKIEKILVVSTNGLVPQKSQ
jgi:hypothetical protein